MKIGFVDIPGFEGRYAINQEGQVWSYPKHNFPGRFLFIKTNRARGYNFVHLRNLRGESLYPKIHLLLAKIFIPNPQNRREINHKNGIRTDNRLENLEWSNRSENIKHAWNTGLRTVTKKQMEAIRKVGKKWGPINFRYLRPAGEGSPVGERK